MKRADLLDTLDIGNAIKKLREIKGISQKELAKGICDRTNITKLENGHSKIPSFTFILLICERLEVTVEEFLNFALTNSYSLNHKFILNLLMNHSYSDLKTYLMNIDCLLLNKKDNRYYNALLLIIEYMLTNTYNKDNLKSLIDTTENYINDLGSFILLSNENNKLEKFLNSLNINKIISPYSSIEYIYLLEIIINYMVNNDNLEKAKLFLEYQINFINNHEAYRYLINYYSNKIKVYKNDIDIAKDSENKLHALMKLDNKVI